MTDQLTRTAQQVRNGRYLKTPIHLLRFARTTPDGRLYRAGCGRTLHAGQGAILTTRTATCAECTETAAAEMPEADDA